VVAETAAPITYAEGIDSVCRRYVETPHMAVAGVGGADVKARVDVILANRIGRRLTLSKRVVLAAVAVLSLTVPIVTGATEAAAFADGQLSNPLIGSAIDPESRFEVASIKPFDASGGAQSRFGLSPGQFDFRGLPLRALINQGLLAPIDRIFGWPDWIDSVHYTVSAQIPDGAPTAALPVMIENLLKDRFNLVSHREMRELPIYNLVPSRSDRRLGPTLKENSAQCQAACRARRSHRRIPIRRTSSPRSRSSSG
jgi:hypothetical protein